MIESIERAVVDASIINSIPGALIPRIFDNESIYLSTNLFIHSFLYHLLIVVVERNPIESRELFFSIITYWSPHYRFLALATLTRYRYSLILEFSLLAPLIH